jgi:hypothetical protein|tara:strand:- start:1203 stop:1580 length:378 start_codon:yes stop_codon:yes gene_type:complete
MIENKAHLKRRLSDKSGADRWLARVMTIDFVVATAIVAFGMGSLWISLKADVASAQETTQNNSVKLSEMGDDLNSVKTTVAVIQVQAVESELRNAERAAAAERRDAAQSQELRDIKQILLQGASP